MKLSEVIRKSARHLEHENTRLNVLWQKLCNAAAQTNGGFFTEHKVENFRQAMACGKNTFCRFLHSMLHEGIYLARSPFEFGFISAAHTDEDIQFTLNAAKRDFQSLVGANTNSVF